MIFRISLFSIALFLSAFLHAQVILPYEINKAGLFSDTAKTTEGHTKQGMSPWLYARNGFTVGDIVPDFVLYDTAGTECRLSNLLAEGKPVLLIAGSYTCPQTRRNLRENLIRLNKIFGKKINIRLIYTLEAHPDSPDICPYTGAVFNPAKNIEDSIFFHQPKNYLERKKMAEELVRELHVPVPVLMDSPDNTWWKHFGPAPNNAYLLSPSGLVYKKYGIFESEDFDSDFNALLNDGQLMKNDPANDLFLGTTISGDSIVYAKNDQSYMLIVYNTVSGKIASTNERMVKDVTDLDKLSLAPGEYSLVIKVYNGRSYCIRYKRD